MTDNKENINPKSTFSNTILVNCFSLCDSVWNIAANTFPYYIDDRIDEAPEKVTEIFGKNIDG